ASHITPVAAVLKDFLTPKAVPQQILAQKDDVVSSSCHILAQFLARKLSDVLLRSF
ncbi:hypothetical protein BV898_20151, partial [Hypsibius exemplaris]